MAHTHILPCRCLSGDPRRRQYMRTGEVRSTQKKHFSSSSLNGAQITRLLAAHKDKAHVIPLSDTSCQTLFLVIGGWWHLPVWTLLCPGDFALPPSWQEALHEQPRSQTVADAASSPAPASESRERPRLPQGERRGRSLAMATAVPGLFPVSSSHEGGLGNRDVSSAVTDLSRQA